MNRNPYVGIQHTVFEQGWQRALKALADKMEKDLDEHAYGVSPDYWLGFDSCKGQVEHLIDEVQRA